jgi:hypothetical protein
LTNCDGEEPIPVDPTLLRKIQSIVVKAAASFKKAGSKKDFETANEIRLQIASLLPLVEGFKLGVRRSTDGLSGAEVYRRGRWLGIRVASELGEDVENGSDWEVFQRAWSLAEGRKASVIAEVVDGADPEYFDLLKIFNSGLVDGLNQILESLRRRGYDIQTPP